MDVAISSVISSPSIFSAFDVPVSWPPFEANTKVAATLPFSAFLMAVFSVVLRPATFAVCGVAYVAAVLRPI